MGRGVVEEFSAVDRVARCYRAGFRIDGDDGVDIGDIEAAPAQGEALGRVEAFNPSLRFDYPAFGVQPGQVSVPVGIARGTVHVRDDEATPAVGYDAFGAVQTVGPPERFDTRGLNGQADARDRRQKHATSPLRGSV